MSFLVLLLVLWAVLLGNLATSKVNDYPYPIAKQNCNDRCGDVMIPYPFGLTKDCYLNSNYSITCNTTSYNPPKTFLGNSTVEVRKISVEGQLTIMKFVTKKCYQKGIYSSRAQGAYWSGPFKLYVNQTANKFVAVGCDTFANVYAYADDDDQSYETGSNCMAKCTSVQEVQNGICAGKGCCETEIPNVARNVYYSVDTLNNYTNTTKNVYPCSYAFVVQKEEFKFSSTILTKEWDVKKLPLVLDWAISNETCITACQGNTTCVAINSEGYRCACKEGYQGNPYLSGCQDIDECANGHHNCSKHSSCTNYEGGFECPCKKGYRGNGKSASGCTSSHYRLIILVLGIAIMLVTCGSCLHLGYLRRKSIVMKQKFFRENGGLILEGEIAKGNTTRIFSAQELRKATNNYDQTRIIGEGGFGIVYKGHLLDGRTVAVKKPKRMDKTQVKEFINEVSVLSQTNHRNIVKLYGCCLETQVPLLVYEFIENGTLSEHLRRKTIPWPIRLRIATETAEVLSYLHSAASPPIVHRDVKPANILLDNDYTAKVSDFGASRLVLQDQTQVLTAVQGTLGYLDPEYLQTHELTEKSDVYSFGVVLVELLTGRGAISSFNGPGVERNLSQHFLSLLKQNELFKILDGNIVCEGNTEELQEATLLAERCLKVKGDDRPTMKAVAVELDGLMRRAAKHHPWPNNNSETSSSMEPQIPFGYDNTFSITTTATEYDSLKHHMELPVAAGR